MEMNGSGGYGQDTEQLEIELLLEGVFRKYGFDFRHYAYPSIRRRVWHRVHGERLSTISALQEKVLHDRECFDRLLRDLVIHVTEMFRDPRTFLAIREKVVPMLRELSFIRIWHAGCSTGEEAYSMAILLHEEQLYDKTRIYATDMNGRVLQEAKEGVFPVERMKLYTANYMQAGGIDTLSRYYTAKYNSAILQPFLKRNIVFAQHNLATDRSFNEFDLILCRNVMIYFNRELQDRVHHLIYDSLAQNGVLALGNKESIDFSPMADCYEPLDKRERLYRKIK